MTYHRKEDILQGLFNLGDSDRVLGPDNENGSLVVGHEAATSFLFEFSEPFSCALVAEALDHFCQGNLAPVFGGLLHYRIERHAGGAARTSGDVVLVLLIVGGLGEKARRLSSEEVGGGLLEQVFRGFEGRFVAPELKEPAVLVVDEILDLVCIPG